jgi:hypothetical protein
MPHRNVASEGLANRPGLVNRRGGGEYCVNSKVRGVKSAFFRRDGYSRSQAVARSHPLQRAEQAICVA